MSSPDPAAPSASQLDREVVRERVRTRWTDSERRIFIERAIERLPRDLLAELLKGLLRAQDMHGTGQAPSPSLLERVTRHVEATRRGEYLGNYALRNRHGEREPEETDAWVAATAHLFDLALARCAGSPDDEALTCLTLLSGLVQEVDERVDELVCFEDSDAALHFSHDLARSRRRLGAR